MWVVFIFFRSQARCKSEYLLLKVLRWMRRILLFNPPTKPDDFLFSTYGENCPTNGSHLVQKWQLLPRRSGLIAEDRVPPLPIA